MLLSQWLQESVARQTKLCDTTYPGARDKDGYGKIKNEQAHRFLWEIVHGPIPKGYVVRHLCNNSRCTNINHLALGTAKDNMADKVAAGNHRNQAKIDEVTIERILELAQTKGSSEIAKIVGFKQSTVSHIITGINAHEVTKGIFMRRKDLIPHPSWVRRHGNHVSQEKEVLV